VATRPSRPCDRRDYGTPCRICRGHERLGDLGLPYDLAIARFNLARADVQLVLSLHPGQSPGPRIDDECVPRPTSTGVTARSEMRPPAFVSMP
jgi:hypothetical protein